MHTTSYTPQFAGLTEVRLYGHLRKQFGKSFRYAIKSPLEAVQALVATIPGFAKYLRDHSEPGYKVLVGTQERTLETLSLSVGQGKNKIVKIVPYVQGAKKGGLGTIIIGVALVLISIYAPGISAPLWTTAGVAGPSIAGIAFSVGLSLIMSGVSSYLVKTPKSESSERADNQPSYNFNGPVNTVMQGGPVPVLYGELEIGGQVISAGIDTAQISMGTSQQTSAPAHIPVDVDQVYANTDWGNGDADEGD